MRSRRGRSWITVVTMGAVAGALLAGPAQADLVGSGTVTRLPAGVLTSSPDAAYQPGTDRIDVVVRGSDNQLWRSSITGGSMSAWSPLPQLPGGIKGEPTIVSWQAGRLDVFVRGPDDKLWQTFLLPGSEDFQPWLKPVGDQGMLASSPEATVRNPGRLDVFVQGTDGHVYQRFWEATSWNSEWIGHGLPSGGTVVGDQPAATWSSPSRVDIFVRGSDDKLWQRTWNGSAWSGWARPVGTLGTLDSTPEATSYPPSATERNIAVFTRGTDGGVWGIDFTAAGWGNWVRFGQPGDRIEGSPGATSRGQRLEVFGRGTDNQAYWYSFLLA
jgi:hypothetical protein